MKTTPERQFYFVLHQFGVTIILEWIGILNTYFRKEALRKCKFDDNKLTTYIHCTLLTISFTFTVAMETLNDWFPFIE